MSAADLDATRRQIVDACHLLAGTGCVREIVGHVSVRLPGTNEMLVRCRRRDDPGVEFTAIEDIKRVDFDGISSELTDGYILQSEFPIHSEIYRRRPDVNAIVHGHPRSSLLCGILDMPIRPLVGAYDPGMLELAAAPIPIFPRAVLINSVELGQQLAATMGEANVCLLQGHGVVTVGPTVEYATMRAVKLETLAEITLQASATGVTPNEIPAGDIPILLDGWTKGAPIYIKWTWDFYRRKLGLLDR